MKFIFEPEFNFIMGTVTNNLEKLLISVKKLSFFCSVRQYIYNTPVLWRGYTFARRHWKKYKRRSLYLTRYRLISHSVFFDAGWYSAKYPDVKRKNISPVKHYLLYGWRNGNRPSRFFYDDNYFKDIPVKKRNLINPLVYYELKSEETEIKFHDGMTKDICIKCRAIFDKYVINNGELCEHRSLKKSRTQPLFCFVLSPGMSETAVLNVINSILQQTYCNFIISICLNKSSDAEHLKNACLKEVERGRICFSYTSVKAFYNAVISEDGVAKNGNMWFINVEKESIYDNEFLYMYACVINDNAKIKGIYGICKNSPDSIHPNIYTGRMFDFHALLRKNFIISDFFAFSYMALVDTGTFDDTLSLYWTWDFAIRFSQKHEPYFLEKVVGTILDDVDESDDEYIIRQKENQKQLRQKHSQSYIDILKHIDINAVQHEIERSHPENTLYCGNRKEKILVSLTSYPQRIGEVHFTIYSLMKQKVKPDLIVLYLAEEQFPDKEKNLPALLLKFKSQGLEIHWCKKDIKSFKKLIPAILEFPEYLIVTADDDLYYDENWLGLLYDAHLKNPEYICCHRAHLLSFDTDNNLLPYKRWKKNIHGDVAGMRIFPTSGAGVLYPPCRLHSDTVREDLFLSFAPSADDVWFWAMAVTAGTKMFVVPGNISELNYVNPMRELNILRDSDTLFLKNVVSGNDTSVQNVFGYYPYLREKTAPNSFILIKKSGKAVKNPEIKNVKIKFIGGGNVIKFHEPLPKITKMSLVCSFGSTISILPSSHHIKDFEASALSHGNEILIGDNFSCNGAIILAGEDGCKVKIGQNCMFSSDIQVRTTDSHALIDLKSKQLVNKGKNVIIGNSVRVGNGVKIWKGANIPNDCVIGTGSFVNKTLDEENAVYCGTPAVMVRNNICWSRLNCSQNEPFLSNMVSIVFITDDDYIIPTSTAITSMIKNKNPDTIYDIHIVTTGLNLENINRFKEFISDTIRISFITASTDKYKGIHKFKSTAPCVATVAALLKFDLPNLLPDHKKVLYLDGDIIVADDLTKLFLTDINDYYAAAVPDSGKIYSQNQKLKRFALYFNSGVMLLNLQKLREKNISEKLVEEKRNSIDFSLMDQNIFNIVFAGKIRQLEIKYNFLYINLLRAGDRYDIQKLNDYYNTRYENLDDILNKAVIIHCASKDKPWKYYDSPLAELWYQYFLISPYKDIEQKRCRFII